MFSSPIRFYLPGKWKAAVRMITLDCRSLYLGNPRVLYNSLGNPVNVDLNLATVR
jgi:hypothetical protein